MWISDVTPELELTESGRLEFNRRIDIANAVIKDAIRLFSKLSELDELIVSKSKAIAVYWYLIILSVGMMASYFLPDNGYTVTLWAYMAWVVFVVWAWKNFEVLYLKSRRDHCNERLHELDVIWSGGTGLITFWSLASFASKSGQGDNTDALRAWWFEQSRMILERVRVR